MKQKRKRRSTIWMLRLFVWLLSNEHLLHDDEAALVCHGDGDSLGIGDLQVGLLGLAVFEVVAVEGCLVALLEHGEVEFESEGSTCGVVAGDVEVGT